MEKTRRMVLWDEPKEKVIRMLEVNGFEGAEGERLYKQAFKERTDYFRMAGLKRIWIGLAILAGAIFTIYALQDAQTGRSGRRFAFAWILLALGGAGVIDGFFRVFTAPKKRGSIADEED